MTDRTSDELAQDYSAMGDSITLITDVIAGLELMKAKSDWGSESMTATTSAISAGNGYTAS